MRFYKLFAMAILAAFTMWHIPAYASGCALDGVVLKCSEANSAASVAEAFADSATREALATPIHELNRFKHPSDLETFRKSIEKNWRQVRKAELQQRNQMRRRQISADQFEEWSKTYDAAEATYKQALIFYRTLVWHGKNGKPPPSDSDS
jgi:hypothetical protein